MRFSRPSHPNCFSLETLKCIIRNGVPILVKLIDLVYSVIIVLSQTTLLRQLTFLLESQTVIRDSHSSALLYLFISSGASICSKMAFPSLENSDHVAVSVSIAFRINSNRMPCFIDLWLFSCWLGRSSWSFERCSIGRYL